jgi:type II secretory pathway pseudopilin PulG
MNKNQKGFSLVEVFLIIIIVTILGGTGWYVYNSNKKTNNLLNTTDNTNLLIAKTAKKDSHKFTEPNIPSDWISFVDKKNGFKFAYPKEYGQFSKSQNPTTGSSFNSAKPSPPYIEGSSDSIHLAVQNVSDSFSTLKYGPTVKFVNNELIVQEVNPADSLNKVGEPYKGWLASQEVSKEINGLKVYIIKGGYEGNTYYRYAIANNSKVIIISLPGFYDGVSMLCAQTSCKPNDKTRFDSFAQSVLDSIQKI